jgi:hypothetical protein
MHWFLKFIFGIKLYMIRRVPLQIIRSFLCTHSYGICHTGLLTAGEQQASIICVPPCFQFLRQTITKQSITAVRPIRDNAYNELQGAMSPKTGSN